MLVPVAAYVVAISMLLTCGLCALALMRTIDHFDPPEARESPEHRQETAAV
jgi:hypothetical protein